MMASPPPMMLIVVLVSAGAIVLGAIAAPAILVTDGAEVADPSPSAPPFSSPSGHEPARDASDAASASSTDGPDADEKGSTPPGWPPSATDLASNGEASVTPVSDPSRRPVIAVLDMGINPYHLEFRASERTAHPSTYLPAYPASAVALNLTFDAASYEEAVRADEKVWSTVLPNTLYWVPGTRIVGIYAEPKAEGQLVLEGDPAGTLDAAGHGTLVASAAAGRTVGANPDALIVAAIYGDVEGKAREWVAEQDWIDVASSSTGDRPGASYIPQETRVKVKTKAAAMERFTADGRLYHRAAGNHLEPGLWERDDMPSVIRVGAIPAREARGEDGSYDDRHSEAYKRHSMAKNPEVVVVDERMVAHHQSIDGLRMGAGSSVSAPAMAGYASGVLQWLWERPGWEARLPGDVYARASLDAGLPVRGPLADGVLEGGELREVLRLTARPIGVLGSVDGPEPTDFFTHGYGVLDADSVAMAKQVLSGEIEAPERPWEDYWFERHTELQSRLSAGAACREHNDSVFEWHGCPTGLEDPQRLVDLLLRPPPLVEP